jgi:tRNA A37 methylthiotransferase MiaB
MRRFGGTDDFLQLIERARSLAPGAGFRTNVILGFPGETEDDVAELETLCKFLVAARLDVVGVFGYSDEDGTEAETFDDKLDEAEIRERVEHLTDLVEELTSQRAEDRVGETLRVLLEHVGTDEDGEPLVEGRAEHQGPEVDGTTTILGDIEGLAVGDLVDAVAVGHDGVDLVARVAGPNPTEGPR